MNVHRVTATESQLWTYSRAHVGLSHNGTVITTKFFNSDKGILDQQQDPTNPIRRLRVCALSHVFNLRGTFKNGTMLVCKVFFVTVVPHREYFSRKGNNRTTVREPCNCHEGCFKNTMKEENLAGERGEERLKKKEKTSTPRSVYLLPGLVF